MAETATTARQAGPTFWDVLADRWLVGGLVAGLIVRAALVLILGDEMTLVADERLYQTRAQKLLNTGALDTGDFVRPPLYFLFHALTISVFGPNSSVFAAKLLQCVASCATALPVYRSALRVGGVRAARFAAAFLLFDPTLIAFSHLLWPETLFLLMVAIIFDGIVGLDARKVSRAIVLGSMTGAAMLLKPVFGLFTLVLAASWLKRLGWVGALHLALIFGGAAAVVISPWVVRNQIKYGGSIVLENQGSYNLWSGNSNQPADQVLLYWWRIKDPVIRNRAATEKGLRLIRDAPGRFARRYVRRAFNFFGFEYFAVRHFVMGGYPDVSRSVFLACFWIIQVGWALALMSAAAGLGPVSRDPTLRIVLWYALVFVAITSAMVVTTRFRIPFAFVTTIAAGVGLDRLLTRRVGWRSALLAVLVAALLAVSASRPVFLQIFTGNFQQIEELHNWNWLFFRY